MNLLLLHPQDLLDDNSARVTDYRAQHLYQIHKAETGSGVRVGLVNGLMGQGTILRSSNNEAIIEFECNQPPPPATDIVLVLALPRPQMLKRSLQTIATLGIKEIYLIASARVEKSYWSSPQLLPTQIKEHLTLGLEQGVDTQMPRVHCKQRFKPFVEDELPALCEHRQAFVAHPGDYDDCPRRETGPVLLAIGPEGGFLDFEVEAMQTVGCQPFQIGPRILRVETAVPMLISRFYPF